MQHSGIEIPVKDFVPGMKLYRRRTDGTEAIDIVSKTKGVNGYLIGGYNPALTIKYYLVNAIEKSEV